MKLDKYIIQDEQKLRLGYTAGSCAVGATTTACLMLESGQEIDQVNILAPAGIELQLGVCDITRGEDWVKRYIVKDAGDDPDTTDGLSIYAEVHKRQDDRIILDAKEGVGRIQCKGLFGEVGDPAINPVPKKLLLETLEKYSETGLSYYISILEGQEVAEKTFGRYMGIEGGLSILGTKGIVYPMSAEALLKSIYMELEMIAEKSTQEILLTPGDYGEEAVRRSGLDLPVVEVSNYVGQTLEYVYSLDFRKFRLIGHIGKFCKLTVGIFQAHSSTADTRMEAFVYYLALMGTEKAFLEKINSLLAAGKALDLCLKEGYGGIIRGIEEGCNQRIIKYLRDDSVEASTHIYPMNHGVTL